jgi:PAS domain S-box-containing protein
LALAEGRLPVLANVVVDPIFDPTGALVGYAKVTRDLTERRSAEETLRKSEEQFCLLVQTVTDYAIYMLDPNGIVTNWNAGAERIKGYAPEEIIGQHFSRFYGEEDRAKGEPAKGLATALSEGRFEKEGGGIERTAGASGRMWSSTPSASRAGS